MSWSLNLRLEHADLALSSIDEGIRFFTTAFPHWRIRGSGHDNPDRRWVHFGSDDTYVCISEQLTKDPSLRTGHRGYGFNHVGFVVDDVDGLRDRMIAAGLEAGNQVDLHPSRKRVYIGYLYGSDFEFIEYLSDLPDERNQYD